jgi:hypothetical protein
MLITIQAKHDHWTIRLADHLPHCARTVRFERTAPAQNDEIALSREIEDGRAGLPSSHCKAERGTRYSHVQHDEFRRRSCCKVSRWTYSRCAGWRAIVWDKQLAQGPGFAATSRRNKDDGTWRSA